MHYIKSNFIHIDQNHRFVWLSLSLNIKFAQEWTTHQNKQIKWEKLERVCYVNIITEEGTEAKLKMGVYVGYGYTRE